MNDGYDVFCFMKLEEYRGTHAHETTIADDADEVVCACAEYLHTEGYATAPDALSDEQAMAEAALTITQTIKGEPQ